MRERTEKPLAIRNGLKIFSPLKAKKKYINKVSKHRQKEIPHWIEVKQKTALRANYRCEIQGPDCLQNYGLTPHHIIHRSQGGLDECDNIIWGCAECHNHQKYPDGMPLTRQEAYQRIGVIPLDMRVE